MWTRRIPGGSSQIGSPGAGIPTASLCWLAIACFNFAGTLFYRLVLLSKAKIQKMKAIATC